MSNDIANGQFDNDMILDKNSLFALNGGEATNTKTRGLTTVNADGDVLLANAMPKAEYMYGCVPTAVAMLLGYYDLYGYRGNDFSNLIAGDVDIESRGTDGNPFNMNAFDTALGLATATKDYVYRFFSREDIDVIVEGLVATITTTPEEELEFSFVNNGEGPDIRTDVWNCIADYLGTGQFWRGNNDFSTTSTFIMLENLLTSKYSQLTFTYGDIQRTIDFKFHSSLYGLYLYVQDKGYSLDMKVTGSHQVDLLGGEFTFEDYQREIDAGRPVLVSLVGHAMIGYGYNAETNEIIFDDCYEADKRMTWNGTYNYAGYELSLQSISTVGLMASDDMDLAVVPIDGTTDKLLFSMTESSSDATDYCFCGSPLYLSFGATNLGTSHSGNFDAGIYIDGVQMKRLTNISIDAETVIYERDIPLEAELGVGLHTISVRLDPDNAIQEISALNNFEERALMVLKEGTNVIQGTKRVTSGEISTDDYVMNGAAIHVKAGGTAEGTLIQGKVNRRSSEGAIFYLPGAVYIYEGGLISNAYVYEYGELQVWGMAEYISVFNNGRTVVNDGGTISGLYVDVSGKLTVESGGCLAGQIMLETGAKVVFEEGAFLNFDLTQTVAGGEPMLNDLSLIKGTPTFTITVSDSPISGTYSLAEGATGFNGDLSVADARGAELGVLTVGDTLSIGNADYTLTLTDDALFVNITVVDKTPTGLVASPEKVSWESTGAEQYFVEFTTDNFEHVFSVTTSASATDLLELPAGTYQWHVKADEDGKWAVGKAFVSETESTKPQVVQSNNDGNDDLFFANQSGTWSSRYRARHVGSINDWTGTDEIISPAGKGRIQNLFFGSADPNLLCLTDSENGDAIFVDDIFTDLPENVAEHTARLYKIQEIRAGAGDDIVDMTSQQFEYNGDGLTIRGGDGNDVIWANKGDNWLFGDAGNDRIVGASGNDIIAGGSGNDLLHGGGGDDIFVFGADWGNDMVEQRTTGCVTLWFQEGDESKWNAQTLTYTDGEHSVKVAGVPLENISLIFDNDHGNAVERHAELLAAGAFEEFTSKKIFEDKGVLAYWC